MSGMRSPMILSRTARRCLSTKGPRGPRSILNKSRTSSRLTPRTPKPSPLSQSNRHQSSQQPNQQNKPNEQPQQTPEEPSKVALVSTALAENESSDLIAPVRIPDDPEGVLDPNHPAWDLLNNSSLVIQRQIEMMNVFLGFEQANRYVIMNGRGETIGYMAEQDHGLGNAIARQAFRTHRSFTAHIFDKNEREVLRIHRPFSWISSRIRIYDPCTSSTDYTHSDALQNTSLQSTINQTSDALQNTSLQSTINQTSASQISPLPLTEMRIIGEAQQQWAPLRRKYNLFNYRSLSPANPSPSTPKLTSPDTPNTEAKAVTLASTPDQAIEAGMQQFAHVNEAFLSWDFTLRSSSDHTLGSVNRNFGGFAREIFTDTGVYALRMDSAALGSEQETAMTLDQRAVMLATAVSIDFDYFSRHSGVGSGGGFGFMPIWFPGMGGAAEGGAAGGAVGGAAGEVGAAEGALGGAARGAGVTEGAVAGAGTVAGMEAMNRGGKDPQSPQASDDASPTSHDPFGAEGTDGQGLWGEQGAWGNQEQQQQQEDLWGQQQQQDDPWSGVNSGGSSGGEGGGGGFDWGDWF